MEERQWGCRLCFRERASYFSLGYLAIQPSAGFGTRRRNALRGEGFAWVPDLGSFFKLIEVEFSPYLSFTLILSVLLMFRLNEAMGGRLISPKTWDRIVRYSLGFFSPSMTIQKIQWVWAVWVWFVLICVLDVCLVNNGPGMAVDFGFTK